MIKRLISFVIAMSCIMTFTQIVPAEENGNFSRDIEIMTELGLFNELSSKDADETVTRAEFTALVLDMLNVREGYGNGQYFLDVDKSHPYFFKISGAAEYGIIKGDGTYFYPDRQITYAECVIILLNAMGYKDLSHLEGGYTTGYLKMAGDVGLGKGISENDKVTVGMAARLMLNAGESYIYSISSVQGDKLNLAKEDTFFWSRHKISNGKGIFSANQYSLEGYDKGVVRIGDFYGVLYNDSAETQYIGYNVEYYYREEDGENVIYYIAPIENKNEVLVVPEYDVEGYDANTRTLSYFDGKRLRECVINSDVTVIYNGKACVDYFYTEAGSVKSIFEIDDGEIKFISNDGDSDAEVINISSFKNCVVTGVNFVEDIVFGKYMIELNFGEAEKNGYSWILTDVEGKIKEVGEISEKSVITYIMSRDGEFLRGVVTDNKIGTKIDSVYEKDGVRYIKADGEEYTVSNDFYKKGTLPSIGNDVILYIDYLGRVCGFEVGTTSDSGYAFVMKKYYDDAEEKHYIKMLTQDNVKKDFRLAKSVKIDGDKYTDNGLKTYMESFKAYQVIMYKLNSNNEVSMIDTTTKVLGGENDMLKQIPVATKLTYYPGIKNYGGKVIVPSDVVVFKTPDESSQNRNDYSMYYLSALPTTSTTYMNLKLYSHGEKSFVADCVQHIAGDGTVDAKSPYMLVSEVLTVLDANDNPVLNFKGVNAGGEVSYNLSTSYKYNSSTANATDANTVKPGDIIKYSLDDENNIDGISAVYVMGTEGLGPFGVGGSWFDHGIFYGMAGYLWKKDGNYISLVTNAADLATCEYPSNVLTVLDTTVICRVTKNGAKIFVEKFDGKNVGMMSDYVNSNRRTQLFAVNKAAKLDFVVFYEE